MPRTHLPLLPLPVLAVIFAVAACSRPRSDEPVAHVIPTASPYFEAAGATPDSAPAHPTSIAAAPMAGDDETPSGDEVKAFERTVAK